MPRTISLCIIFKNEEKRLARCLSPYLNLVDEIVAVDTGSTDKSMDIAILHGASTYHIPWNDDFSRARNFSLENANMDWILWSDADDIAPPESCENIKKLRDEYDLNCCFSFMVKNSQDGVLGEIFSQTRMFPNHKKIRFRNRVHEQVLPSILELGYKLYRTNALIIHTGYSDPKIVRKKQERNLRLLKLEIKEGCNNPTLIYCYAGALADLDRPGEAFFYYLKAMEMANAQDGYRHIADGVPIALATLYGHMEQYGKSKEWAGIALKNNPSHVQVNSLLAEINEMEGKEDEAVNFFEKVLTCEEKPGLLPVNVNMLKINACSRLGGLYRKKSNKSGLIKVLEKALEIKG